MSENDESNINFFTILTTEPINTSVDNNDVNVDDNYDNISLRPSTINFIANENENIEIQKEIENLLYLTDNSTETLNNSVERAATPVNSIIVTINPTRTSTS